MKLVFVLVLALPLSTRADTADSTAGDPSSVATANEANLESQAPRHGTTFSLAIGGAVTLGFGVNDSTGRGGSLSFRLGHVMTPSSVLTLELTSFAAVHEIGDSNTLLTNTDTNLLMGVQHYTSPSFWLRVAGGIATYKLERDLTTNLHYFGPAGAVGFGIDIVRHHYLVLAIEEVTSAMVNRDGVLVSGMLGLGLSYY